MKFASMVAVVVTILSGCASNAVQQTGPASATSANASDKVAQADSSEKLYCEATTGSRLARKKVCFTEDQRKAMRENAKSAVDGAQRGVLTEKGLN